MPREKAKGIGKGKQKENNKKDKGKGKWKQRVILNQKNKGKGKGKEAQENDGEFSLASCNMCCICLKEGHRSDSCPYRFLYPAGAIVGPFARIVCMCCGKETPDPGLPGVDWDAYCYCLR